MLRWPLLVVVVTGALFACKGEQITETKRDVKDAWHDETIDEIARVKATGGKLVEQRHMLHGLPDAALSLASLDKDGFATGASYRREGPKGKRYVEFRRRDDGKLVVFSRGDDETIALPELPVVDLEMEHLLTVKPSAPMQVVALDIENAVVAPATLDASGLHVAPIERVTPKDPATPSSTSKAPFIESKTPKVVSWCKQQASASDTAIEAAKKIALAVKPKLDAERAGGPPSALNTLAVGAFDQGGAALVVACLRALEKPARIVTGTVEGDAAMHTWAQVHDGSAWIDVDALDIDTSGAMKRAHTALVEGFPGPLTTGRLPNTAAAASVQSNAQPLPTSSSTVPSTP